jgi:hypothetical protein
LAAIGLAILEASIYWLNVPAVRIGELPKVSNASMARSAKEDCLREFLSAYGGALLVLMGLGAFGAWIIMGIAIG